jgi:hypothetical protein
MPMFRKKPVVIEAHQIGDDGWPDSIWQGVSDNKIILHLDSVGYPKKVVGHVEIKTLEGKMSAGVGDWIIKGVKGEFYPCKPDIFAATYEPADTPSAPSPEAVARAALEWAAWYLEMEGKTYGAHGYSFTEVALRAEAGRVRHRAADDLTLAAIVVKAGGGE